ncbi:MAG: hypothetical protein VXW99_01125 [Pseudomonadota bacterium]|nr:hypothetical protein [Pseudomonadota bacterium]
MVIELKLEMAEVNSILKVLGELPSKSGAWPLMVKIQEQTKAQLPDQEQEEEQQAAGN